MASGLVRRSLPFALPLVFVACSKGPRSEPEAPPVPAQTAATTAPTAAPSIQEIYGKKLKLAFHADPLPNLIYQLDCMAGRHPCSKAAYEALWKQELGFDSEDQRELEAFRALRDRFQGRLEVRGSQSVASPLPLPRADRTISARLAIAGLVAHTPDEHISYLGLVTTPADAKRAQAIIDHFRPRFDAYWQREGKDLAESTAQNLAKVFERENLVAYVEDLARFYESDLPDGATLDFHMMARPAHASLDAARQIGGHAIIECPKGERPEERAPVVVHEMLHYLYASAADERLAGLARSFVETNDPLAAPSHAILDEALATALGTAAISQKIDPAGFSKKMAKPLGLYAEPTIDRVAKAIRPLLETRLAENETLYGKGFPERYLAAVHAAYPAGMPPIAFARPLVAALEPRFWGAFQVLDNAAMASSLGGAAATDALDAAETAALFDTRSQWGGAFFVTHKGLAHLHRHAEHIGKDALSAIVAEAKTTDSFVYATERAPGVYRFVFVSDDPKSMERLVRALAQQPEPFEGALEVVSPKSQ